MAAWTGERSRSLQSLRLALVVLGMFGAALAGVEFAIMLYRHTTQVWVLAAEIGIAMLWVGAGLLAWWRRPSNRLGLVLVAGSLTWYAAALLDSHDRVLIAVGSVCATIPIVAVVYLLLCFPSGRLGHWLPRVVIGYGCLVSLALQAPQYMFNGAPAPYDLLVVGDRPDLVRLGYQAQHWAGAAGVAVVAIILLTRLRAAPSAHRRILLPLYVYGLVAILFVPVATTISPSVFLKFQLVVVLELLVFLGVPVAFVVGVLSGGFARTGEIDELGAWLGESPGSRPVVAEALARVLGDPSLELAFHAGERTVDARGVEVPHPVARPGRGVIDVVLGGRPAALISYDANLIADAELVRQAGRVVAIEIERERLTAELRASQHALRLSRMRIVEAADLERRRVARNLHDGLQVRLVLLGMEAQQHAEQCADPDAVIALRRGIDTAAAELRGLVHDVMPPALTERGLSAATEDLIDRLGLPATLELQIAGDGLPAAVESTAYFVVSEGLANALKYAQASALCVRLHRNGDGLTVEVTDNGVGGAWLGGGSGLRGLHDRVDTLGGQLHVTSRAGHGTSLRAELPCGS